jgi:hypothetical protein
MSTGKVLNHGVSGYACLGQPGDFQQQRRGEPWENAATDPIKSYLNAQSHIGQPMSNFNEPWNSGILQMENWNAQPYRAPVFGEPIPEPSLPNMPSVKVASINYPSMIGKNFPQELPSARIHQEIVLGLMDRQNMGFEGGTFNGDNKVFLPQTNVNTTPNAPAFQGGQVATGVHPGADKAGQQTAPNTTRPDVKDGQSPYQKLPEGQAIGTLQPNEAPALYDLAPPPAPQVLPGEGTAPLLPTAPQWW